MLTELVKEAATEEEAKAAILAELDLPEERVMFEVLQAAQKKVLGLFGGAPARVKGTVKPTAATAAAEYLRTVLAAMGAESSMSITEEEGSCVIALDGEDLGFVIGRRGDTLDALQYLTGLVANRAGGGYYRVTIDIGDYREKREQSLIALAKKWAGQAARTGRKHSLDSMNPYERRIIHTAVQGVEGATSWSVGSEPNRHVVIGPSDDNPRKDSRPRGGRGRGSRGGERSGDRPERAPRAEGDRGERSDRGERRPQRDNRPTVAEDRPARPIRTFVPRSNPLPTADGATPPSRTESEKETGASLYGRIDLDL